MDREAWCAAVYARTAAEEMIAAIEDLLFMTEKKQKVDVIATLKLISRRLAEINDKYFVANNAEILRAHAINLEKAKRAEKKRVKVSDSVKKIVGAGASKKQASPETVAVLEALKETAQAMLGRRCRPGLCRRASVQAGR